MFFIHVPELLSGNRESMLDQGYVTQKFKDAYLNAWKQPGAANAAIDWYRANIPEDYSKINSSNYWPNEHARITVPSLLIWSTKDRTFSKEAVLALPKYTDNLILKK